MHIVYVTREYPPSLRGGGIATYVKEVAGQMVSMGHQVTVIAASDDTRLASDCNENGIRVIRLSGGDFIVKGVESVNLLKKFRFVYRFYSYRKKIIKTISQLPPVDVVEVADYGAEGLYLDKLHIPYTVRLHMQSLFDLSSQTMKKINLRNAIFYYFWRKEGEVIKHCKHITSCSQAMAKWTMIHYGISEDRISVINNPVNLANISDKSEKSGVLSENKINIVYVGTICAMKGCKELVESAKLLKKQYDDLELWLFGKTGTWAEGLSKIYKNENWIHFYGKIEREKLFSIYKEATVVVLPSWFDNFPMTCIEAMLAESIIVGSQAGGMSEMIENGKTGFLVQPKNISLLKEQIQNALSLNYNERRDMGEKAKSVAMSRYSPNVIGRQLENYYKMINNESTIL